MRLTADGDMYAFSTGALFPKEPETTTEWVTEVSNRIDEDCAHRPIEDGLKHDGDNIFSDKEAIAAWALKVTDENAETSEEDR